MVGSHCSVRKAPKVSFDGATKVPARKADMVSLRAVLRLSSGPESALAQLPPPARGGICDAEVPGPGGPAFAGAASHRFTWAGRPSMASSRAVGTQMRRPSRREGSWSASWSTISPPPCGSWRQPAWSCSGGRWMSAAEVGAIFCAGRQCLRADQRIARRSRLRPKRSTLHLGPRWGRRRAGPHGQPRSSADSQTRGRPYCPQVARPVEARLQRRGHRLSPVTLATLRRKVRKPRRHPGRSPATTSDNESWRDLRGVGAPPISAAPPETGGAVRAG
jgi:hypothetical protein